MKRFIYPIIILLFLVAAQAQAGRIVGPGGGGSITNHGGLDGLDDANDHTWAVTDTVFEAYTASATSKFINITGGTVSGNLNVTGFVDGVISEGSLADDNTGLGVPYGLSPTYTVYTSYGMVSSSSNVTTSAGSGGITLDSGVPGKFSFRADVSVTAVGGPELIYGVFLNITSEIMSFSRPVSGVHHHSPTMQNLSSNAAYDTYSSLEYLSYQDGDYVVIDESDSGVDAFVHDLVFNGNVLYPEAVELLGVQYTGQAAHEVEGMWWNYSTIAWVDARDAVMDFPDSGTYEEYKFYVREYGVPSPVSSYVDTSTKEAKFRIIHKSGGNDNDRFRIDKVQLHDSHNTSALSFGHNINLAIGDTVSLKIKSDKNLPVYIKNLHFHLEKKSNLP